MLVDNFLEENKLKTYLNQKNISKNTYDNYFYDLRAFSEFMQGRELNKVNLDIYLQKLQADKLSPTAIKRKISSINQYLKYIYENLSFPKYLQLEQIKFKYKKRVEELPTKRVLPDAYSNIESVGQFICLLILEFGLTPGEIQSLHWKDFNWSFKFLTVEKNGLKRILPMSSKFILLSKAITNGDELFSKSRQFLFYELKKYTKLTAQELREQYILRQVTNGVNISDLANLLGLSTIVTLEKYYKN